MVKDSLAVCIPLLEDKKVLEVARNPDGLLWVNRLGEGWLKADVVMNDWDAERLIKYAASCKGAVVTGEKNSMVSCLLPFFDFRFQGIIPPVSQRPTFTIRKKALLVFTLDDYVQQGILSPRYRDLILKGVSERKNILVVGGTNTGKTTFCNAVLAEIAKTGHRIVMIEEPRELQCMAENCVSLEANDYTSMNDLLKTTMRLSPDRIIVGEVRDGSALTLMKAWTTGHPGGCGTVHASSAIGGLTRIEQLILEAVNNPQSKLIGEAVDLIVYMELIDNRRIVKEIVQVIGYENGRYLVEPL